MNLVRASLFQAVQRAPDERGMEEGVWECRHPSLPLSRLDSLAAVFVRYHQLRAWNRLSPRVVAIRTETSQARKTRQKIF